MSVPAVRRPANTLRRHITPLDQEIAPFGGSDRLDTITDNPNTRWAIQLHQQSAQWQDDPGGLWPDERSFEIMRRTAPIGSAEQRRAASLLGQGWTLRPGTGDGAAELHSFWSQALGEIDMAAVLRDALRYTLEGWKVFETVGDVRQWEGRDVFMPVVISEVDSWDFRWTQGRDLVDLRGRASGRGVQERWLVSRNPRAAAKWWTPAFSDSRQAYGRAVGTLLAPSYMQLVTAIIQGFAQAIRAQGFMKVQRDSGGDMDKASRSQIAADQLALPSSLSSALEMWSATGVLQVPIGHTIEWEALQSAVDGWVRLWDHLGNAARELLQGATLTSAQTGPNGSRALGDTMRAGEKDLVACDAHLLAGQFARLLKPWSMLNAGAIFRFPRDRQGRAVISAAALPCLEFAAVSVSTPGEQAAAAERLRLAKDLKIEGPDSRWSVDEWIQSGRLRNVGEESDEGVFVFGEPEEVPQGLAGGLLDDPGPLGERVAIGEPDDQQGSL